MKKIALNLGERFALLEILPREGNFATLKLIRKLREMLSLTEDEWKEYEVKQFDGQLTWQHPEKERELEFSTFSVDMIVKQLKELDKAKKLTDRHFTLYVKFISEPEEDKAEC